MLVLEHFSEKNMNFSKNRPRWSAKKIFFSFFSIFLKILLIRHYFSKMINVKFHLLLSQSAIFLRRVNHQISQKSPRRSANSSLVCKFDHFTVFKTLVFIITIKFPFQRYIAIPFTSWVEQKCL